MVKAFLSRKKNYLKEASELRDGDGGILGLGDSTAIIGLGEVLGVVDDGDEEGAAGATSDLLPDAKVLEGDLEEVTAGARVGVSADLLVPLHVLDLHLIVRHPRLPVMMIMILSPSVCLRFCSDFNFHPDSEFTRFHVGCPDPTRPDPTRPDPTRLVFMDPTHPNIGKVSSSSYVPKTLSDDGCEPTWMNLFSKDALKYHAKSIKLGFTLTTFTFNNLIRAYSQNGLLPYAHKLFDEMPRRNVYSWNAIISAYIKSQNFTQARALFDAATSRDLVTYNTMLAGYIGVDGYEGDALELFRDMGSADGGVGTKFDEFTLTTMLNMVAKLGVRSSGVQLHGFMVRSGNDRDGYVLSSLIDMYSKCGAFHDAYKVFVELGWEVDSASKNAMVAACCRAGYLEVALEIFEQEPELNDIISWNTLITGYAQNGKEAESLDLFVKMGESGVGWNEHTFTSILSSCARLKNLRLGKEVHTTVLKTGLVSNSFVKSAVVDVYCKCGSMMYAEVVYATIEGENSFATTSMIAGHSSRGDMLKARMLFDSLTEKNSIVWTSLFSGYVKSHQCESVFELIDVYRGNNNMVIDAPAIISVLSACALLAALDPGKQLHAYVVRAGIKMDEILISSFIDMYAKSGNLSYAEKMYLKLSQRDTVVYNIMIAGYANHGREKRAIQTYEEMLEKGLKPDAATFIALLSACRHCGLLELGENYFRTMTEDFNIMPETDHFACMIDLYGRANQLEKAVSFLKKIPMEPDAAMLGAFFNACKLSKNLEFARKAAEALLRIRKDDGSRYVQLANVYAAEENWAEMRKVRERMRGQEAKKFAGCSWLYRGTDVHAFSSGGLVHPNAEAINSVLATLRTELGKGAGKSVLMFG